jgi:enamine deaminase RidA (YjgF/YER057c/UK114 family)
LISDCCGLPDTQSCIIYLVDGSEFAGMNEAWDEWVPAGNVSPARATITGVKLADPGWKIEIVVTAALP